jgi:beta-lactam-binding protein with PASTA domain
MVRAPLALSLVVVAGFGAGCGATGATAPDRGGRVVVPNVRGEQLRPATCRLQRLGLRWHFRGERDVYSRPLSGCGENGIGGSLDDIPVTGQTPRAGTRVRRGKAVVIDDLCTDAARKGAGACA